MDELLGDPTIRRGEWVVGGSGSGHLGGVVLLIGVVALHCGGSGAERSATARSIPLLRLPRVAFRHQGNFRLGRSDRGSAALSRAGLEVQLGMSHTATRRFGKRLSPGVGVWGWGSSGTM